MRPQPDDPPAGTFVPFEATEVDTSVPARFEKIVRAHGPREAVATAERTLTYDALNAAANRIAHAVLDRRGQATEPVALLLDNDASMVSAIIGVLKAGKAYVPLDARRPAARLAEIVEHAVPALILSDTAHASDAAHVVGVERTVNVDDLDAGGDRHDNLDLRIPAGALAYVIYTSGSTGAPKGVFNDHRSILHEMMRYTNDTRITPEDRHALLIPASISGSLRDIFGSLLNGSTLCIYDVAARGIGGLGTWMAELGITIVRPVPTVLRRLAATLDPGAVFPRLRLIHLGGEPVHRRDVELCRRHIGPRAIVLNGLGTTETGLVRRFVIDGSTALPDGVVPVGHAVDGFDVVVLGDDGREVPPGEVGEIVVKSAFLSAGYWRRPDLTRASFGSDPEDPRVRWYRTGDLGRMSPDGSLTHLGRKDHRVKIRGQWADLAALETAMLGIDGISEVAAVVVDEPDGRRDLVAYFVPHTPPGPPAGVVRRALAAALPAQPMPTALVAMEALPTLPGGKLDRRALPLPSRLRPDLDVPLVPPRTPIETDLARIWQDALRLDAVGALDHFLDLGGDSLAAQEAAAAIERELGVPVEVADLASQTLGQLASWIEIRLHARRPP